MPTTYYGPANLQTPLGLSDYYASQRGRIPQGDALENASSRAIAGLLEPPAFFPDTDRQAAEVGAMRGVGGSPSADSTGVRMTDEERIRRIALGEQLLSGAYARNPALSPEYWGMTPYQQAQLNLQQQALNRPVGSGGGGGSGGGNPPAGIGLGGGRPSVLNTPWSPGVSPQDLGFNDWYGTRPTEPESIFVPGGGYPNPNDPLLPLYPGGTPVGADSGFGFDWSGYGYEPLLGFGDYGGDYSAGGGIAGLENIGGGASDFLGLLDYYGGE